MIKYGSNFKEVNNLINYSNRGMGLEHLIEISNKFYRESNKAIIYKKPTPIRIVKTINLRGSYKIIEAYFESPSTTDYNGIYKGKYIDFEAKETRCKTSFPLNNIHSNQLDHLFSIIDKGGIGFLIISFVLLDKTYLFDGSKLRDFIKENTRKSIPLSIIEKEGILIPSSYINPIDYLSVVDKYYFL